MWNVGRSKAQYTPRMLSSLLNSLYFTEPNSPDQHHMVCGKASTKSCHLCYHVWKTTTVRNNNWRDPCHSKLHSFGAHGLEIPFLAVQARTEYINLLRSIPLPSTKHRFSLFPKDRVLQQMELCSVAPFLKKP